MFITFLDINGSDVTLNVGAIWGITIPTDEKQFAEVLLARAEKSIKVTPEVAKGLKELLAKS